jgi:hypothetical protein
MECIVLNCRRSSEKLIGKDLEGSGGSLVWAVLAFLPVGTEEKYESPSQGNHFIGLEYNLQPSEYTRTQLNNRCS